MAHNQSSRPRREYYAVVFDRDSSSVLFNRVANLLLLPIVECGEVPHFGNKMSDSFRTELKKSTNTSFDLVFLYSTVNEAHHRHIPPAYIAMFESQQPVKLAHQDFIWVDLCTPRIESFGEPDEVQYVQLFLKQRSENGVRPWEKPRWLMNTSELAANTLKRLGYSVVSKFEQFHVNSNAIVLRAETDKGRVYLKCSNNREGKITECLSSIAPNLVRKPLHVDKEREWMLMEDYGPSLDDKMSTQDSEKMKHLLALLQRKAEQHIDRLIECGARRVNPSDILRRTEKMLDDVFLVDDHTIDPSDSSNSGVTEVLDKNVVRSYNHAVGTLLKHLYEKQKIPLTINHGDLYDGNIIKCVDDEDSYVIFDWGSAYVDLPFTDVDCLLMEVAEEDEGEVSVDSYLQYWTQYASLEKLKELRKCLQLKEALVNVIRRYEYAIDKDVRPYLELHDLTFLQNVLHELKEAVAQLQG